MSENLNDVKKSIAICEYDGIVIKKNLLIMQVVDNVLKITVAANDDELLRLLTKSGGKKGVKEKVTREVNTLPSRMVSSHEYSSLVREKKVSVHNTIIIKATTKADIERLFNVSEPILPRINRSSVKRLTDSSKARDKELIDLKKVVVSKTVSVGLGTEADDSYENGYGRINRDVEDSLSELFKVDRFGDIAANVLEDIDEFSIDICKKELEAITSTSYGENERGMFLAMNYRLSCLGIAPRWRGINRDRNYGKAGKKRTAAQEAYFRDIQAFDLEWLYRNYHGHHVDTSWTGIFEGIFTSPNFDTIKASQIAGMTLKPAKKAEYLMLTPDMEKELFMLRSATTDRFLKKLFDDANKVRIDLLTIARRNRRVGKGLQGLNLERRVNLWLAANMVPNSTVAMTIENYKMMTGESLKPPNCKRLLSSLNSALREVESKYVLS